MVSWDCYTKKTPNHYMLAFSTLDTQVSLILYFSLSKTSSYQYQSRTFPHRKEFSLHATNGSAREVGGDFYEFFFIDQDRLAMLIADVSGRGIPAALFKNICSQEEDSAVALEKVDFVLCQDNDAFMLVTLFLAYYDVKTGRLVYANEGHNGVLLLKPDGSCEAFGLLRDVALGVLEDHPYQRGERVLNEGEALVFYTDGVTEASSPHEELFGEARLEQLLTTHRDQSVDGMCGKVALALSDFQKWNQFDDITLMILRRETNGGGA